MRLLHCPRLTMLPREVFTAALKGDITAVKNWLAQGGDPNEGLEQRTQTGFYVYQAGTTLLMVAAYRGRLDVVRLLVDDHGADVNVRAGGYTALSWAASGASGSTDCIEYLLAHGANISGIVDGTRIICNKQAMLYKVLGSPRIVRMLLAKGVVLTTARFDNFFNYGSLEESAKERARMLKRDSRPVKANRYAETAKILAGVRLAGHSYKRWVLKDYMALLRVRSLLARGRATMAPSTPEVIVRLFGGRTAAARRPPTRRSRPPPERAAGVPDPVFWKVMEYWRLGDWRHPGAYGPI